MNERHSKTLKAHVCARGNFLAGVIVLAATFGINAETWVFKRANKHIYSSGQIVAAGTIYDRNGKVLAQTVNGERKYNSNSTVRRATSTPSATSRIYLNRSAQRVPRRAHGLQLLKRRI